MHSPADVDAMIDEIHAALRADLGLESTAALAAILGALRPEGEVMSDGGGDAVAELTRPLLGLARGDAHLASKLAGRILTGSARRFEGLYPTPAALTELAAELMGLPSASLVLDPACGAGAFLLPFAARGHEVYGVDRSAQMIELARYALPGARLAAADGLLELPPSLGAPPTFDAVVLNPPFGIHVDPERARRFVCGRESGRTPSEALFVERAASLLRPGGRLAAIVPSGFFRNRSMASARRVLGASLRLVLAIELPAEAFMHSRARVGSVLFLAERRGASPGFGRAGEILVERAEDAGHDRRGRAVRASDLTRVRERARAFLAGEPGRRVPPERELEEALTAAASAPAETSHALASLCPTIRLGKTPPKEAYAEDGHFIVKVGNLTGHGLDFSPRHRNFVTEAYARAVLAGRVGPALTLARGDLLVTSSAHAKRYIAEKIDRVEAFPEWVEGPVFYVGELLLLRPRDEETGLDLLGYFRSRAGKQALRELSRGQTAHLLPRDVRVLGVPPIPRSAAALELRARLLAESRTALELERERRGLAALADELHGEPTDD